MASSAASRSRQAFSMAIDKAAILKDVYLGAGQAAKAIGVSLSTVRSQVLSLRRKTGHRSVPALLAALRSLPPLLLAERSFSAPSSRQRPPPRPQPGDDATG